MKVTVEQNQISIERENSPKIYSESTLLHKIKLELIEQGHDVIKKRMWKDGHMMGDESSQYIRERNWKWCAFDNDYVLRLSYKDYNAGKLILAIERWDQEKRNETRIRTKRMGQVGYLYRTCILYRGVVARLALAGRYPTLYNMGRGLQIMEKKNSKNPWWAYND